MPCDAAVNGADQIFAVRTNHGGNYMPKYRVKVKAIAEVKRHIEIIAESRVKAVEVVKEMMAAELTEEAEEFENWEVCYVHSDMVPAIDNRTRIVDVQNVDDSGDFDSSEDGL